VTNLAGGALGSAPYQTGANATGFIASPTTPGTYLYAWQPSGSIIAPIALNSTTLFANAAAVGNSSTALTALSLNGVTLIANAQITFGTGTIPANQCGSNVGATFTQNANTQLAMAGVTTTTGFGFTGIADYTAVTGWGAVNGLVIFATPTAGNLNYKVCNITASSITPSSSTTWNVIAK
jgi:hypothetical protein